MSEYDRTDPRRFEELRANRERALKRQGLTLDEFRRLQAKDEAERQKTIEAGRRARLEIAESQQTAIKRTERARMVQVIAPATSSKRPPRLIDRETRTDKRILPTFKADNPNASKVPAALNIVDRTGALIRHRARGAPQACRIWLNILLAIPPAERKPGNRFRIAPTAQEIIDWCYPKFQRAWWTRLRTAIDQQSEIYLPTGEGERKRLIEAHMPAPKQMPALDSTILFDVHLPPGILSKGAPIDPLALNDLGRRSAPRWRALIAVSAAVWIPGITQIPPPPKSDLKMHAWSKTAKRYPVFTLADRREIAFGSDCKTHLTRAQINAAFAHLPGMSIIDTNARCPSTRKRGWRIVPEQAKIAK